MATQAHISSLADELKLEIFKHLEDHCDVARLQRVCKDFYRLANPEFLYRHLNFVHQGYSDNTARYEMYGCTQTTPLHFFDHTRSLTLCTRVFGDSHNPESYIRESDAMIQRSPDLRLMPKYNQWLYSAERDVRCRSDLENAALLSMTKNLECLKMRESFIYIVTDYLVAAETVTPTAFQQLTTVILNKVSITGPGSGEFLVRMLRLKSLKTLIFDRIDSRGDPELRHRIEPDCSSNLTTLNLGYTRFRNLDDITALLGACKSLEVCSIYRHFFRMDHAENRVSSALRLIRSNLRRLGCAADELKTSLRLQDFPVLEELYLVEPARLTFLDLREQRLPPFLKAIIISKAYVFFEGDSAVSLCGFIDHLNLVNSNVTLYLAEVDIEPTLRATIAAPHILVDTEPEHFPYDNHMVLSGCDLLCRVIYTRPFHGAVPSC